MRSRERGAPLSAGDEGGGDAPWSAPSLWPGSTVCILASGPSRSAADVEHVRRARAAGRCRIIAVNREAEDCPEAEIWYAHDARFWATFDRPFGGLKVGVEPAPGVLRLRTRQPAWDYDFGLDLDPGFVRTGGCSGYQAINLAFHLGARRIVLLGFDCTAPAKGARHWFGDHPRPLGNPGAASFARWARAFPVLARALALQGVSVLNASRSTALDCFSRTDLATALEDPSCSR